MGLATIVENVGAGLYRATPLWDFTRVNAELMELQQQQAHYWTTLNAALDSKRLITEGVDIARDALNAVVEQWKQALIDKIKTAEAVPPAVENDPDTGAPWIDPDRAQDEPLLAAVNAARATAGLAAVSRNDDLDRAALNYLRYQSGNGRTGHLDEAGRGPGYRANNAGYGYTSIGELLAYGQSAPAAAVALWARGGETRATLIDADFVDAGVAYVHSGDHYAAQLWCVLLASPGDLPGNVAAVDPAAEKARAEEEKLKKVTLPKPDNLSPDQLGKASQEFGIAVAKLREAEREVARIQAANLARSKRIAVLEAVKAAPVALDVWCVDYDETLAVGAVVSSMEVPGFWREEGTAKSSVLYAGTSAEKTVNWVERSWNLPTGGTLGMPTGRLAPAEGMTDAAVFVNAALEPGHLKWRPYWRYGVITEMAGLTATVSFAEENARPLADESPLSLQRFYSFAGALFRYPVCGASAFSVGDEVLCLFEGDDRTPVIIGFRREPKTCPGRQSWRSVAF